MMAFICCSATAGVVLKVSIEWEQLAPSIEVGARARGRRLGYDLPVRTWVLAAVCALGASTAHADPQLEASGFVGIVYFPAASQLGDSWAPEQVPGTAPVVGARLAALEPSLVDQNDIRLDFGIEAEVALAASFTGGTAIADGGRPSYFAPVFGWRAHLFARVATSDSLSIHLVAGAGGETVASSSPFMRKETDPVLYWGPGFSVPVGIGTWQVRVDGRHGLMPSKDGGLTSTFEVQLGVGAQFGLPAKKRPTPIRRDLPPPQPIVDEHDSDGDGLPDRLDKCPNEKETVNGIDDGDGCPEPDADGDRIIGPADKCPDQAEDFDGFQDEDGCPDPDNDADGIEDVRDKCPLEPETHNGFEDEDGCPDKLPADVGKALASAGKLTFETNRARVTDSAKKVLANVSALLNKYPSLKIVVIGHPAKDGSDDLARRRADAVKWHLIDDGMISQDRIETRVGDVKKSSPIEIQLVVR